MPATAQCLSGLETAVEHSQKGTTDMDPVGELTEVSRNKTQLNPAVSTHIIAVLFAGPVHPVNFY